MRGKCTKYVCVLCFFAIRIQQSDIENSPPLVSGLMQESEVKVFIIGATRVTGCPANSWNGYCKFNERLVGVKVGLLMRTMPEGTLEHFVL